MAVTIVDVCQLVDHQRSSTGASQQPAEDDFKAEGALAAAAGSVEWGVVDVVPRLSLNNESKRDAHKHGCRLNRLLVDKLDAYQHYSAVTSKCRHFF